MSHCIYCAPEPECVLWKDDKCRVILDTQTHFTGWCKVVWHEHVAEFSFLSTEDADHVMHIVRNVEKMLLETLRPEKINIASLGTGMSHLHWHIIPRYTDDSHFPHPIWGESVRKERIAVMNEPIIAEMQNKLSVLCRQTY